MSGLIGVLNAGVSQTPSFVQRWGEMILPALGQEIMAYLAFALYLALLAVGGLIAVLARNLVRAMLGLVLTFLGVAGMYLLLASPFLAFMQLLIYVGAICVLIFFAVMLVKNTSTGEETRIPDLGQIFYALAAPTLVFLLFAPVIALNSGKLSHGGLAKDTPLAELGAGLLNQYVLPFELISIILLVAMAGGVFLAWDKRYRGKE